MHILNHTLSKNLWELIALNQQYDENQRKILELQNQHDQIKQDAQDIQSIQNELITSYEKLAKTRDNPLQKLMNGKLDLSRDKIQWAYEKAKQTKPKRNVSSQTTSFV